MEERIVRNYSAISTLVQMVCSEYNLPDKLAHVENYCVDEIVKITELKQSSDILSGFWSTLQSLVERKLIMYGKHFRVNAKTEFEVLGPKNEIVSYKWTNPRRLLFFRLTHIHNEYMKERRAQTGEKGIDLSTLKLYFKNSKSYLGTVDQIKFTWKEYGDIDSRQVNSSAYVFDYDMLGIDLLSGDEDQIYTDHDKNTRVVHPVNSVLPKEKDDELPF
jgi:hypothetical protein